MTKRMRVFLTGGTGFVGAAIVAELVRTGHDVLALARSERAVAQLEAAGARAHRGSLEDLESLALGVAAADGVIHTAFDVHADVARFTASAAVEQSALETIGEALVGSGRPLVVTSGFLFLTPGRVATEDDVRVDGASPRRAEALAASFAQRGLPTSIVRLPIVHGVGDRNFLPPLIELARTKGLSGYVGEGSTRWPAVHRDDAARLYRLALEASAGHARYHAVAEEGVSFRAIAEVIGRRLGLPTVSVAPGDAAAHFGALALLAAVDAPASSDRTRAHLGWRPSEPGLLADIDRPSCFAG